MSKRKVWRLNEDTNRIEFENELQRLAQVSGQNTSVEDMWKSVKEDLLASSDTVCGWTKGPPRHRVTWWWNDNVDVAVKKTEGFAKDGSKVVAKKTT